MCQVLAPFQTDATQFWRKKVDSIMIFSNLSTTTKPAELIS